MTEQRAPIAPAALVRRATRMKRVNVVMRRILALPFPTPLSSRLMLLTHTGRKSGRRYRQPVSYVADGDTLLTPGGGNWKLNLEEGRPVSLHLRGRDLTARPELVRDAPEVERLLRHMMQVNHRLSRFVPFVEADGSIDHAKLDAALRHGFCVVRWHLDKGARP